MGVTVDIRGRPMGCPPCVSDANMVGGNPSQVQLSSLTVNLCLQQGHLASALDQSDPLILRSSVHPNPCRIIAPVFEALEALDQNVKDFFPRFWGEVVEVGKDSTHAFSCRSESSNKS